MNLWVWAKRVAADQTGGVEPIDVDIERNPDANVELGAENAPGVPLFVLRVGVTGGFGGTRAGLPVYRRENPAPHPILKEIYTCEVAGKLLEAANIYALRAKVQRQLETIAPGRSLPLCYFRAPRFDYSLAVHEEGDHLVCPVLTGPRIKAQTLAEVGEPVVRHLRTAGYLADDEEPEVLVVRPSDLRQVPPAAVLRCVDDEELWMPTVEGTSPDGPVVGLLTHPAELVVETRRRRGADPADTPPSAPDVAGLLRYVGHEMSVRGAVADPGALYAADVRPEIWARTEELTEPTSRDLTAHLDGGGELGVPIRETVAGDSVGAIRTGEAISVFLAGDAEALCDVIGRHLAADGYLHDPRDLRPSIVHEAPSESLDPAAIWMNPSATGHPPSAPESTDQPEVPTT
jgi:hypothetical protein